MKETAKKKVRPYTLKYWIYITEEQFAMVLAASVIFTLWMFLIDGGDGLQEMISNLPFCFLFMFFVFLEVNGIRGICTNTARAVSLGSTRREAFFGGQLQSIVYLVQGIIIYILLAGCTRNIRSILLYIGSMIFINGVTQITGGMVVKTEDKVISVVSSMVLFLVIVGYLALIAGSEEGLPLTFLYTNQYLTVIFSVGVALHILGIFIMWRNIRDLEVKL